MEGWMVPYFDEAVGGEMGKLLAVRVRDIQEKEMLLATELELFFTEPHYNGFPAVLVRLSVIDVGDLENLLRNA